LLAFVGFILVIKTELGAFFNFDTRFKVVALLNRAFVLRRLMDGQSFATLFRILSNLHTDAVKEEPTS
jgi:hypothetical protein